MMRAEAPDRATDALESMRTALESGFRIAQWLPRSGSTFALLSVGQDSADGLATTV